MNITYKVNGRTLSQEEYAQHQKENESRFSERLRDMLDSRQAPGVKTDDTFLAGHGTLDEQIGDEDHLETITQNAMAAGYRPRPSDFYHAMLADYEGDPKAFFNHGQGKGHLKKVLEERGQWMDKDGDVHSREPEADPYQNPNHRLAPDIVERIKKDRIKENPDLAHSNQSDLEADIIETHGWNEDK